MMTDAEVEDRLRAIRAQAAKAQAAKARAENDLAQAEGRQAAWARMLAEEFGARSPEEARLLLEKARADLAAECARVEDALREAGDEAARSSG